MPSVRVSHYRAIFDEILFRQGWPEILGTSGCRVIKNFFTI